MWTALASVTGPGARIATAWRVRGGGGSHLGPPETTISPAEGGVGRYRHFANGSVYWHPDSDVIVFEKLTLCYEDESEDLPIDELKRFVPRIRRPKASVFDLLVSDPIGLDPQENPDEVAWVGHEGWFILEEVFRRMKERYETRFETQPRLGRELTPSDVRFDTIDRGNYEAEQIARISATA